MDLHEYLNALRTRWIAITVLTLLGAVMGYFYAASVPAFFPHWRRLFGSANGHRTT